MASPVTPFGGWGGFAPFAVKKREFGIGNVFYLTPRLFEPLPFIKRGEWSYF